MFHLPRASHATPGSSVPLSEIAQSSGMGIAQTPASRGSNPSSSSYWFYSLTSLDRFYSIYLITLARAFRETLHGVSRARSKCSVPVVIVGIMGEGYGRSDRALPSKGLTQALWAYYSPGIYQTNTLQNIIRELMLGRNPQVVAGSGYTAQGMKHRYLDCVAKIL